MNQIGERVKRTFPAVSLTLLSIVQAIALELLWSSVASAVRTLTLDQQGVLFLIKATTSLMTIILIWLACAGNVMRFSWQPSTADLLYPFAFGLLQLCLIELIAGDNTGYWILVLGIIFGVMNYVIHATLRRARADSANQNYFSKRQPATLKDFLAHIVVVVLALISGFILVFGEVSLSTEIIICALALLVLIWQFAITVLFWNQSLK